MFLRKGVLKICSKFTGEHPGWSVISIKLLCNIIEITLRHGCSPLTLLNIFRTPFLKNISGRLLLLFINTELENHLSVERKPLKMYQSYQKLSGNEKKQGPLALHFSPMNEQKAKCQILQRANLRNVVWSILENSQENMPMQWIPFIVELQI